jgi:5-methyltetrahydropteroyltriglutamate--homocysteine methyltransferase
VWLALFLGSPAALLEKVAAWPSSGVFLDAVTDPATLDRLAQGAGVDGKPIGVGIVNARNTRLESAEEIRAALGRLAARVPAERLVVTPSAGLEFLPRDRARAKLARLSEGVRAFAERG